MKALFFDPYAGASGDMTIGCLLDLGADPAPVRAAVASLGCRIEICKEEKGHIMATRAKISSDNEYQSLEQANSLIMGAVLEEPARELALKMLDALASAESRIHGTPKEQAGFHEIGALDALADIAGSCAALHCLGVEKIFSLPLSAGGGFVKSEHGLLPIPAPATLEILRQYKIPWNGGPADQELLTPTGAAIFACIVEQFFDFYPPFQAEKVGYGAGTKDLALPNCLRGVIGHVKQHDTAPDQVVQLETSVDDVSGEILGYLIELLMDAGALDVSIIPATMKKSRPGNLIVVVARERAKEELARLLMRETGSLGVRVFPSLHRYIAERKDATLTVKIDGSVHEASFKASILEGKVFNIKPEYEDCRRIASKTGLPLRVVAKRLEEEAWKRLSL